MHGKSSTVVAIRLPDEVVKRLEAEAAKEGLSLGLWVRKLVIEYSGVPGYEAVDSRKAKEI